MPLVTPDQKHSEQELKKKGASLSRRVNDAAPGVQTQPVSWIFRAPLAKGRAEPVQITVIPLQLIRLCQLPLLSACPEKRLQLQYSSSRAKVLVLAVPCPGRL